MNRTERYVDIRKEIHAVIYLIALKEAEGDVRKETEIKIKYTRYIIEEQDRFIDNIINEFDEKEKDEIYCMITEEIINDIFSDNDFNNFIKMLKELLEEFKNDFEDGEVY